MLVVSIAEVRDTVELTSPTAVAVELPSPVAVAVELALPDLCACFFFSSAFFFSSFSFFFSAFSFFFSASPVFLLPAPDVELEELTFTVTLAEEVVRLCTLASVEFGMAAPPLEGERCAMTEGRVMLPAAEVELDTVPLWWWNSAVPLRKWCSAVPFPVPLWCAMPPVAGERCGRVELPLVVELLSGPPGVEELVVVALGRMTAPEAPLTP